MKICEIGPADWEIWPFKDRGKNCNRAVRDPHVGAATPRAREARPPIAQGAGQYPTYLAVFGA